MRTAGTDAIVEGRPLPGALGTPDMACERRTARHALRAAAVLGLLVMAAAAGRLLVVHLEQRYLVTTPPHVEALDIRALFLDEAPVALMVTSAWAKVPLVATRDAVRTDATLWRRMHVEDWDTVPPALRREALDAMLARFGHVLASPHAWDRMNPHDWDLVPQPVRAMAFRHMVEYWSGYYQVGVEHGIARGTMTDTLAALVMSESWFDHRAVTVNRAGNRDLGVAQASDFTRERMRTLHGLGVVDVFLDDEDYFDPWKATRFVAVWMALLLDEVDGDLDAAIRAYHLGRSRALRGEGHEYLEHVRRRLHRFIRNEGGAGAWDDLWRRDRARTAATRPWLAREDTRDAVSREAEAASALPPESR